MTEKLVKPIDIVIPWVNSNDYNWINSFKY